MGGMAEPPSCLSSTPWGVAELWGNGGAGCCPGWGCFAPGLASLVVVNPTPCVTVPGWCSQLPIPAARTQPDPRQDPPPRPQGCPDPAPGAGAGLHSLSTSHPTSGQKQH